MSALYTQPSAMEPVMPVALRDRLAQLTGEILRKAGSLSAQIPSKVVRIRAAALVREMNSYYSNLIEGHKTLPRDIERALRHNFSSNPEKRANQHLSRAHIEVEELMLQRLQSEPGLSIHSADFLCWLHREFYQRLPEELQWAANRSGTKYKIESGVLRVFEVEVGTHQPPANRSLRSFLLRFEEAYSSKTILATEQLVAMAAAHHRLAWIHPFGDGNGRIARLFSHAGLVRAGADGQGLWTLSRGLARDRARYYANLSAADHTRRNELDGRGNLSDRALGEFCVFMLETVLDQIEFMTGLFQFDHLAQRIDHYLQFEQLRLSSRERERLARLLKAALREGEIERGQVAEIVGLRGTSARQIIRLGLAEGLLDSASEKSALRLVFSAKTIESYFPKLYQDLPV